MSANYAIGEFTLEAFTIVNQYQESLDISKLVTNFKLYESIFSKFLTGEVHVADGLNLPKNFRMTGQEYIRISLSQKEGIDQEADKQNSIDKTFRIYKIENLIRHDELTQSFIMRICDPRMFYARRKRISQTLRGRYDQILQNTLVDVGKFRVDEFDAWEQTTPDNKQLICPNWTVERLMDYLIRNSQVGEGKAYKNGMFFYQTMNGGFRFQSMDTMCSMEFPISFSMSPRNTQDTEEENLNAPQGLNTMLIMYKKPQLFDTLEATSAGAYASTLKVYDPIRKLEEENIYSLEKTMAKGTHVSGHPMLMVDEMERVLTVGEVIDQEASPTIDEIDIDIQPTLDYGARVSMDYHNQHSFDNATSLSDPEVFEPRKINDNGQLERRAMMQMLKQHRMTCQIPLRTDLSVGMIIQLSIPTPEIMGEGDKTDSVNDDRYLITDIALSASTLDKQGVLNIECVKESYAKKIETARPLEVGTPPEEDEEKTFKNSRG